MAEEVPQQELAKQKDYGKLNCMPSSNVLDRWKTIKKAMATATVVTDGAKQVVDDFFASDPTRSVRRAAEMLGIKRTLLQRIMKDLE
ncbi:hypothetical protein NPIL_656011 [Nephila pilipes]|uniref:Uncharacterized protein n=1 Tax=Nephila pilipes TaxID=299642 RepID=A0A8X6PMX5_NEPPI|nr:hypothetical protein NPIL_656011 [Nephila pilipes]